MESLSRVAVTSSGKGSRLARRSSSPFNRSRCRLDGLDLAPSAGGCFTLTNVNHMKKRVNGQNKFWTSYSQIIANTLLPFYQNVGHLITFGDAIPNSITVLEISQTYLISRKKNLLQTLTRMTFHYDGSISKCIFLRSVIIKRPTLAWFFVRTYFLPKGLLMFCADRLWSTVFLHKTKTFSRTIRSIDNHRLPQRNRTSFMVWMRGKMIRNNKQLSSTEQRR